MIAAEMRGRILGEGVGARLHNFLGGAKIFWTHHMKEGTAFFHMGMSKYFCTPQNVGYVTVFALTEALKVVTVVCLYDKKLW